MNKDNNFLLEVYTEEIPYKLQIQLIKDLQDIWSKTLNQYNIKYTSISVFATAQRVITLIDGFPSKVEDKIEEVKGPKVGISQQILEVFCKSNSVDINSLVVKPVKNNEYYFCQKTITGGLTSDLLQNEIITKVLSLVVFKKSMKWNQSNNVWARPIRGLLGIYEQNNQIDFLKFNFAAVNSSNYTLGHRMMSYVQLIPSSINDYFDLLQNNHVIVREQDRKDKILQDIKDIEAQYNVKAYIPDYLLDEIVYLTEYPCLFLGTIEKQYLSLPKELLIDIMVSNQRYITLIDTSDNLFNKFIIVSNIFSTDNGQQIISGNEKVLNARLQDGLFFYKKDIHNDFLAEKDKLSKLNYFEGLGTLYEKTERVKKLFLDIFNEDQSLMCDLYKNDLVSSVVFEIPDLQGIMGKYYTLNWGIKNEKNVSNVAVAISEHYKPQGAHDSIPESLLGAKLAFLDKLDALIQFFAIGKQPTGSKDPFALRRAALGIIRILIHHKIVITLSEIISEQLCGFIRERLSVFLRSDQISFDNPYLAKILHQSELNIFRIYTEYREMEKFLLSTIGQSIISLRERILNITQTENDKASFDNINQDLLETKEEKDLYFELKLFADNVNILSNDNESFLLKVVQLSNIFIDTTLINHEDLTIKQNRHNMLQYVMCVISLFFGIYKGL